MNRKKSIARRLREFADHNRLDFDPEEIAKSLPDESDRAFLIVSGSLAEDRLRSRLMIYLDDIGGDSSSLAHRDGQGALNFGSLISFGRTVGYLSEEIANRLNAIRRIRNAAAHAIQPVDFEVPLFRDAALEIVAPCAPKHRETLRYAFGARCSAVGFDQVEEQLWLEFMDLLPGLDRISDKLRNAKTTEEKA